MPKAVPFTFVLCAVALASGGFFCVHNASAAIASDQSARRKEEVGLAPQFTVPFSSAKAVAVACVFKAKDGVKPRERIIPITDASGDLAKLCPGAEHYYLVEQDSAADGSAMDGGNTSGGGGSSGIRFQSGGHR